ncbi:MAG TPA: hypothetical protein VG406_13070 [Isosphaeraceae bacterium]|jgi:hypothetical protein|nr:hypothetical protein [Isosphaeraceae bacterium]
MTRRPALPTGLLAMLALVAGVEHFLARHDVDYVHPWAWDWKRAGSAASRQAVGCDVLCFGDSLVKFGLLPRVLEDRLGARSYNLAVGAGQASATYVLLRRALAAGARPRAIVVDFKPHLLAYNVHNSDHQWPELLTPGESLDLSWSARDAGFFAETMLGRLLPSVRCRAEVGAAVTSALRGESASPRDALPPIWRNWNVNKGAQVAPRGPGPPGAGEGWANELFPPDWAPHPVNASYVRRFLALARSRGIAVYWLLPPIRPDAQADGERTGVDARFARFVESMRADCPALVVLDGRRSGYGAEVHVDPVHLDRRGAAALSADVATVIGRGGVPAAWITLPSYRERPTRGPLEDLEESRVALRDQGRRRNGAGRR